jgi:glycosyltransferase involved in cell wall biosynthesis
MATTTLRVVLDDIAATSSRSLRRYVHELTAALIQTAPSNCDVAGIVSNSVEADAGPTEEKFPGLSELTTLRLGHDSLARAWQHGVTNIPATRMSGKGLIHSPSLFAPLSRHDRLNDLATQTVVTVHDVLAWTHPASLTTGQVAWQKAMARRALKFADAVVVTTHSVANQLNEIMSFGDRIRVVPGAASTRLSQPSNASARALALELPERYIFTTGTLSPHNKLDALITAMTHPDAPDMPLLISGAPGWGDHTHAILIAEAGLDVSRVRHLGILDDADLAVAIERATVFVQPSVAECFSLPILEAFSLGTPVIHSDNAAVLEIAADAGITVPRDGPETYAERLAFALSQVTSDDTLAQQLSVKGLDRSSIFSWQATAEKVWQLHADL